MLYLGSYSSDGGSGLAVASADLTDVTTVDGVPDASWLAPSADRTVLYATNETEDGTVTAIRLADHRILGRQPTLGALPTHLTVHPSGRFLLTANYGSGSVAVHPLAADGAIGPASDMTGRRDGETHAHQVLVDPSGEWIVSVDIGADTIDVHRIDLATGKLAPHGEVRLPAGTGPRHLVFHPDGARAFLVAEYRSEIRPCTWSAAEGRLAVGEPVGTLAPDGTDVPNYPGEIAVSGDGRFCYVSNRGQDSIAVFAVDGLRLLGSTPTGGHWPRHFLVAEDRILVANQRSGTVTAMTRNPDTGLLSTGVVVAEVPAIAVVFGAKRVRR